MKSIVLCAAMLMSAAAYAGDTKVVNSQPTIVKAASYDTIMCQTIDGITCLNIGTYGAGHEITPLQFAQKAGYKKVVRRYVIMQEGSQYIAMDVE